jgi:HK97 family phage major capsid protein
MLKELREKLARQVSAMQTFLKEHAAWTAEDQAAYKAMTDELASLQSQKQRLEAQESIAALSQQYLEPAAPMPRPPEAQATTAKPAENFGSFLRTAKFNRKLKRVVAPSMSDAVVDQCLSLHHEGFMAYVRGAEVGLRQWAQQAGIGPAEIHALLSSDQTLGGYLVPEDLRADIISAEAGYAVLAPLCRTEPTSSDTLVFPKKKPHATDQRRTSGFAGTWRQQGYVTDGTAPTVQNQPTFQQERIPVHSWQPDAVEVSPELLEDAEANVEAIIADSIAECLAFDKDDAILSGVGQVDPEGILNAGITTVNSGGATSIAIGGILAQFSELPAQYRQRATYVMASRTMGAILQLNTGTGGVYLFPPNQWNNTILGRPVVFLDYGMDTATAAGGTTFTAGKFPIIFGDWSRYIIAQRGALRIQRLVERFAPNVGFLPTARLGGHCVLSDAFRIMKIAA